MAVPVTIYAYLPQVGYDTAFAFYQFTHFLEQVIQMKQIATKLPSLRPVMHALGALMLVSAVGTACAQSATAGKPVASLGAITVSQTDLEQMLQGLQPAQRAALKNNRAGVENLVRQRINGEALLREARSKGWADKPEIKTRIDAAVKEITERVITATFIEAMSQVPAAYPSDEEVRTAYEQNKNNYKVPAGYRIAQIYLPTPANDVAGNKNVARRAKQLSEQARKGDFAALAKTESQDKGSAERGGEVGTLMLADMVPEVRDVVAKLKPGQVSEPVQASSGIHILKLLEVLPERLATLDEMKSRLQAALRQQRQQQLAQAYVAGLAPADRVSIDAATVDAVLKKIN
jgi:peptidylprolyl isomerase